MESVRHIQQLSVSLLVFLPKQGSKIFGCDPHLEDPPPPPIPASSLSASKLPSQLFSLPVVSSITDPATISARN